MVMFDYLFKRPMLLSGILCGIIAGISFYFEGLILPIMLAVSVMMRLFIYYKADRKLIFISVLIFVMCLSCIHKQNYAKEISYYGDNACDGEFIVISTDYKSDDYYVSTAQVMKSDVLPEGTKMSVFYEPLKIEEGERISAKVRVKKISDRKNKQINYSNGIFLTGNLSEIEIIKDKEDFILNNTYKLKSYIKNQLFAHLGYKEASTLCALLYGDRGYFTNEFYDCVKSAGVSHIMVVSGLHLSIMVLLTVTLFEKLFYNRFIKGFAVILTVMFLSLVCGFTMSIMRAGITYLFMALGIMIDRKGPGENHLGTAVTIILIMNPYAIFNVAFRLSVLATFGILGIAIPVSEYVENTRLMKNKVVKSIILTVIVTLSAMIMTLPETISVFGYVSVVSVITNLLISSAVTFCIYAVIFALVFSAVFPFLADILYLPAMFITKYVNTVITYFGNLPFATIGMPEYTYYISVFMIFLIIWILLACKKRRNMLRLKEMQDKILKEGGKTLNGNSF
ncbi:MAG: ComEC/Rec2 family competence protein [Clostridia bacterium]|nr:ComEC/Rec2 family competence protein [Clostridia bacterium]